MAQHRRDGGFIDSWLCCNSWWKKWKVGGMLCSCSSSSRPSSDWDTDPSSRSQAPRTWMCETGEAVTLRPFQDKITVSESDNMPEIKTTTELKVSIQQSPVEQKTVAQDIPDAVVKIQDQNFSNNQAKNNSVVGQVIVHNASTAEDCNFSKEEIYVCESKCTDKIGNMYEEFDHKDEASDQLLKPDKINGTGYLKEAPDTNICEDDIELECLKTEEEKDKKKFFQEHVNAESERMNASSEPENIARKVAAVSPLPLNNVSVNFNVHYITYLDSQILAVTGNHECLGQWERYVPLKPNKDGFWSSSILLPVNSKIEWKFVVVEDGKICRWEECFNRMLETGHEDFEVYQCWGYH
ncbi:uncharacterized protein stbd1 isoform X2 [Stegostoma tigrinum]|uniref:uncharacterized protein stbd1 isoform X2 n=1 Tax=Stegostoma tigrinum TaxID=3053191 RepID=UPI00202B4130|nr:uncharacterized protein stbd1 isoform X2 [Stegostoma tigrinum]